MMNVFYNQMRVRKMANNYPGSFFQVAWKDSRNQNERVKQGQRRASNGKIN